MNQPSLTAEDIARRLPGYRLERQLASGTVGVVYLVEELTLSRRAALKVIAPAFAEDEGFRERFLRDWRGAARLEHPNILPIYSVGESGGLLYLVMRYIEDADLGALVRDDGPLSLDRTVRIARQVATALDAVHNAGLIHCDVKPSNILLDRSSDHVYLCDFGIAATVRSEHTPDGGFIGTAAYAAPEQLQGGPLDARADQYALGCVLFECLTGAPPYQRREAAAMIQAHLGEAPARISAHRPELPGVLDTVLGRALCKDPDDRYATCRALADALAAAAEASATAPTAVHLPLLPDVPPPPADDAVLPPPPAPSASSASSAPGRGPATPLVERLGRTKTTALAVGGVVVLAGLLVTLAALIRGPSPQAALLQRIPEGLRDRCSATDVDAGVGAVAALRCSGDQGAEEYRFTAFASELELQDAYAARLATAGVQRSTGDCASASGAEHPYPGAWPSVGRTLCHTKDGQAFQVWVDYHADTLAEATRADGNDRRLYSSWAELTGIPSYPTAAERDLYGDLQETACRRTPASALDAFPEAIATIECQPLQQGAVSVRFYRFANLEALHAAYDRQVRAANPPTGVSCKDVPADFRGETNYVKGFPPGSPLGRVLCYPGQDGELFIEWTSEPLLLLAQGTGRDAGALAAWWSTGPGPTVDAIIVGRNERAEPPFPTPQEQALLDRIPAASRNHCTRGELSAYAGATVSVVCPPPFILSVTYYQFADRGSLDAAYANISGGQRTGSSCADLPPDFVGEAGYTRGGASGRLACGFVGEQAERQPAITWTNDALLTMAFAKGFEPAALMAWWSVDAGPA